MKIMNLLSSYRAAAHSILVTIDDSTLSVLFHSIKQWAATQKCMKIKNLLSSYREGAHSIF
jgi:hypothetical protein